MPEIDLLIFDLDGTLVDSRESLHQAVNYTLKQLGLEARTLEEVSSFIGGGVEDLMGKSLPDDKSNLVDKAVDIFEAYYSKHPADKSRAYDNVEEILKYFSNKKKMVITNAATKLAEWILKELNLREYFFKIQGADDNKCLKPSTCQLDKALSDIDIKDERIILVGDLDLDIEAGKKAGFYTCGVTYGIGDKGMLEAAGADFIIDDILELKEIIKK